MKNSKRGISPVIATVLLIAMVIIIGLIIFLWFRGLIEDRGTKFGQNIQTVCNDVKFEASYSNILRISNTGNVPIFDMKVKLIGPGSQETVNIKGDLSNKWPGFGLKQGGTFSDSVNIGSSVNKIVLIPVLLGTADEEEKTFTCNDRFGFEIDI